MDTVPIHAGRGALIAAGIAWAAVATLGFFAVLQTKEITELKASLESSEAVKPLVPMIKLEDIQKNDAKELVDKFKEIYPTLNISANGGEITIQSKQTSEFPQFREAIGHVTNAGRGWKVKVESMCVGRECKIGGLNATLKVQKLRIDKPVS